MRVKLVVAYDGTAYHGWQLQKNGDTIEGQLNKHLSALLGEEIRVTGGSRTDAGVHALGNVAVFDTETRIPADRISYALNKRLPEDIRVRGSCQVAEDFHPRRCDSIKTYEYKICHSRFPVPVERLYSYFLCIPFSIDPMREAAGYLVGEHDFRSFCSANSQAETTVRKIQDIRIREEGERVIFRISGNGFLYNMVRIIVGTLLEVGKGKYPPAYVKQILGGRDRTLAGPTAPACGLTLVSYQFLPASNADPGRAQDEK